jgi:hypothetical protein
MSQVARVEDEIAEIERRQKIDFGRLDSHHVGFDQTDTRLVFCIQLADAVLTSPFQH